MSQSYRCKENVIEWIDGSDTITCTFSQKKFINRTTRLAESDPSVRILAVNPDGSILAKLPLKVLHLYFSKGSGNMEGLEKARLQLQKNKEASDE